MIVRRFAGINSRRDEEKTRDLTSKAGRIDSGRSHLATKVRVVCLIRLGLTL